LLRSARGALPLHCRAAGSAQARPRSASRIAPNK
jgi:hypothetical protein